MQVGRSFSTAEPLRLGHDRASTEEDGTGHQVATTEDSAVRMIGQRDRNNSLANALPAGGRHHGRCALLVQQAIADPHVGRRDQFGSHGDCLHRATDSGTVTSLLGFIPSSIAHTWMFPSPARMVLLPGVDDHSPTAPSARNHDPSTQPTSARAQPARSSRLRIRGNRQFGRAIPSTSEAPNAMRGPGGISSTCPQCAGSGPYFKRAVFRSGGSGSPTAGCGLDGRAQQPRSSRVSLTSRMATTSSRRPGWTKTSTEPPVALVKDVQTSWP